MADPNDLVTKFKALSPQDQDSLLNELTPDELTKLHDALKGAHTSHGAGGSWEPGTLRDKADYHLAPGEVTGPVSALKETAKGILAGIINPIIHPIQTTESMGATTVATGRTAGGYPSVAPTGNKSVDQTNANVQAQAAQEQLESGAQQRAHPEYTLGTFAGPALVGAGAAKLVKTPPLDVAAGEVVPSRTGIIRKGARIVTGTGEAQTQQFVDDTVAANEAAKAKAADRTAAQQEAHAGKVQDIQAANKLTGQKHVQKTLEVQRQNAAASEAAARKEALGRGVETLSKNLNDGIKNLEQQVKTQADAKYDALNAKVSGASVPIDDLMAGVDKAESKLAGSPESIKVFRSIMDRAKSETSLAGARQDVMKSLGYGDSVSFEDLPPDRQSMVDSMASSDPRLQAGTPGSDNVSWRDVKGYSSEIGKMLRHQGPRGTLSGDIYQALKSMQDTLMDMKQKMADSNGAGPELKDANGFYRNYMQTFHEPLGPSGSGSPVAQALRAEDPALAARPFMGASGDRGLELLAKYSPELTNLAKTIRDATKEAKGIKSAQPKPLPGRPPVKPIPEVPPPVQPEITKVGPEELQKSKQAQIAKEAKRTGQAGTWLLPFTAMRAGTEFATLNVGKGIRVLSDIPIFLAGREAVVRAMRNPDVMEFISRPSARDLEILNQLPDEYKTSAAQGLTKVLQAAKERNLAISPELAAFAATYAGSQPNRKQLLDKGSAIVGNNGNGGATGMVAAPTIKNLFDRPVLHNSDGTVSTTRSFSIGTDEGEVLIPRVYDGKDHSEQEAIDHYRKTGEHLGIFDTPKHADAYAVQLHNEQAKRIGVQP